MPQDSLDRLLHQWRPDCPLPDGFADGVWAGIRAAESSGVRRNPAGLSWRAVAAAAVLVGGVLAGVISSPDHTAAERSSYLAGINPFAMAHER